MRVLLVEDDPLQAQVGRDVLMARGHTVVVANSVGEAQRAIRRQVFELAIVDVVLGDGDGFELVAELRGLRPAPSCVLVTGNDVPAGAQRAAALGARFFTKPVDFVELTKATHSDPDSRSAP